MYIEDLGEELIPVIRHKVGKKEISVCYFPKYLVCKNCDRTFGVHAGWKCYAGVLGERFIPTNTLRKSNFKIKVVR